ncbi:hypothetical protein C8J57DRAFT_1499625 [Mycena rebaudengoi]|nr:hypothetical protein C8J57DRAFT_1499625 [Mycena rebaudengoi]
MLGGRPSMGCSSLALPDNYKDGELKMYNINVDVAAVLSLISTTLIHTYNKIHISVPATLDVADEYLARADSLLGKCAVGHGSPTPEELDGLQREFFEVREEEASLESASPWGYHAIKRAFKVATKAKCMKVRAMRIATNTRFRDLHGGWHSRLPVLTGMKRTLTQPVTVVGSGIGNPYPEGTLTPQNEIHPSPTQIRLAMDLLTSKQTAQPCSCSAPVA